MRIIDFNHKPSARALNENAAQMFGQKLNLESFTLEQLQDARNKLRTKISQFESASNFSAVYEDGSFQKNKLFLDVLNAAIEERESVMVELTDMERMVLDKVNEGLIDINEIPKQLQEKAKTQAQQKFMGMVAKKSVKESRLNENEEDKAALIMSARDMVDRVTSWMETTASMQAEAMIELADAIRDELGSEQSQSFEGVVKPALASIYTALETARKQLSSSVAMLAGEQEDTLGAESPVTDLTNPEDNITPDLEPTDDFSTAAPAAGGDEAAGRATRESVEYSRKIGLMFSKKK